jgi:O-antigen/teichoic acid export membrane protein
MAAIVALLIGGARNFQVYVVLYLISKMISLVYCMIRGREIVFAPRLPLSKAAEESLDSMKIGVNLMLANIASMLILGIGRFFIDQAWGIEAFARFSLSLQLTGFFLQFIAQVSIVLFPALRRFDPDRLKDFYGLIGDVLSLILPLVLLMYTPVKFVLARWLPQYQESLASMALLLPICLFDGKMQMLFGTYFKVLRRERALLAINLMSMLLSALLALAGVYVLKNLYFVIISMVVAVAFRSAVSEIYLARLLGRKAGRSVVMEALLTVAFMLLTWFLPPGWAFAAFSALYAAFLALNRDRVKRVAAAFRKTTKPM